MKLRSVRIRHYKSLDNVTVAFDPAVTVFVGPNAVGKSNLIDALRFTRDAVKESLDHAVSKRGGMIRLRQLSKTKPYKVSFRYELGQQFQSFPPDAAVYEFTLNSLSAGNFRIEREIATAKLENPRHRIGSAPGDAALAAVGFERDADGTVTYTDGQVLKSHGRPDQLVLGADPFFSGFLDPGLTSFISGWRFSALYPNTLRERSTPDTDSALKEDGANWASILRTLKRTQRGRAALERINEAMRAVLPTFVDVPVSAVGSYLVPRFRFKVGADEHQEFDPVQLSDGTLRIFGILLSLYQQPAPSLLVVEEPELTVHPGVLGVLAEAFKEASEQTQIIVTTHSPQLIDHFAPEQIRVVSAEHGLTQVAAIKRTQQEAIKRRLMSAGEFMHAEGLQPEEA